uniref:Uncharacterized protein n=1 Tax=Anguilla anguilla TaxID=7936 RepID=A0A0E9R7S8_ANGAN
MARLACLIDLPCDRLHACTNNCTHSPICYQNYIQKLYVAHN